MTHKNPICYGYFSARLLQPLKALVDYARETEPVRLIDGNICFEPCHEGGAFLVAVTGHCTVIIHDKDAHASVPVTLDIPDDAFAVAAGPKPIMMYCEGDSFECPLPEWTQPERVHVSTAGMFISTKMRNPDWAEEPDDFHPMLYSKIASSQYHATGSDYRLTPKVRYNWRHALSQAIATIDTTGAGPIHFNPAVPALLSDVFGALATDKPFTISHQPSGGGLGPFVTRMTGRPEIVALWMPMRAMPADDLPSLFLTPLATHGAPEGKQ